MSGDARVREIANPDRSASPARRQVLERTLGRIVLALTFLIVVGAVAISSGLVVYTAWVHDLREGFFALVFAVMSGKIALHWFLWKEEADQLSE
ncbi:Hypothetical Protein RradSPS_1054 [Rubrobacter radiotolerans]|uniref:Uncharacterized protein n=1 Tax=Rubrobacter radiotolerans TaxID=42256 RepID=A0A023X1I6_RUBRA|nr:hypothetical protein [Rubrobacter radiotolerans]AHY46337.1 Hypothetical Protein RradSPS_1054 [Rubrobacter radiotolerans]MDX5893744.1 hypothetical protein [Rubrobacter radiotolerans]SMC04415.1 hypothetical protein SAMN00767673_1049 [Rubrobacter radiotolerans DSM 5868]